MTTLFPKTIEYERTDGAYLNKGRWVGGTSQSLTFLGSVQSLRGKEAEAYPVNRENRGAVKIYASERLQIAIKDGNNAGDVILWEGSRWELIIEHPYKNSLIEHYKYIAQYKGEIL